MEEGKKVFFGVNEAAKKKFPYLFVALKME